MDSEADLAAQRQALRGQLKEITDSLPDLPHGYTPGDKLLARLVSTIGALADVGSREVEVAHERLTRATNRLTLVTWVLVFATVALIGSTVAEWFHVAR